MKSCKKQQISTKMLNTQSYFQGKTANNNNKTKQPKGNNYNCLPVYNNKIGDE